METNRSPGIFAILMMNQLYELRRLATTVLLSAMVLLNGACGDDAVVVDAAPSGPAGVIEATVNDSNAFPARKVEIRLLQPPRPGTTSEGGDLTIVHSAPIREPKEGTEMVVVQKQETNDFGKARLENIPPGDYLLSAGTFNTGIVREWIKIEPGATMNKPIKLPGRNKSVNN